jgi:hypothetical protein
MRQLLFRQPGKTGERPENRQKRVTKERNDMKASEIIGATMALVGAMSIAAYGQVSFGGFEWQPLGQAQLNVASGSLKVANIGSSGNDGVRLLLPNDIPSSLLDLMIAPDLSTFPTGAFLQQTALGYINGVSGQVIESERVTATGGQGLTYNVDASPLAPSSLTVNYYLQGVEVLSETGISPVTSASASMALSNGLDDWDVGMDKGGPLPSKEYPTAWWTPVQETLDPTFGGGTVITDGFDVVNVGDAYVFGGYSAADYTAAGISSFTIDAVAVPEPSTIALVGLGTLGLLARRRRAA